jgi:hypothetical protein
MSASFECEPSQSGIFFVKAYETGKVRTLTRWLDRKSTWRVASIPGHLANHCPHMAERTAWWDLNPIAASTAFDHSLPGAFGVS